MVVDWDGTRDFQSVGNHARGSMIHWISILIKKIQSGGQNVHLLFSVDGEWEKVLALVCSRVANGKSSVYNSEHRVFVVYLQQGPDGGLAIHTVSGLTQ